MTRLNSLSHFYIKKFGLSADVVTKSSNGTCSMWKTSSVTFNLSTKTKTLPVQGKGKDYTRDLLLQTVTIEAVNVKREITMNKFNLFISFRC